MNLNFLNTDIDIGHRQCKLFQNALTLLHGGGEVILIVFKLVRFSSGVKSKCGFSF